MQGESHTPMLLKRRVADIVFLLDITGSNARFVDLLQHSLDSLESLTDWRARVIGFRDAKCDGEFWLVTNPFVANDIDGLRAQLTNIQCEGGGDQPESLLDALDFVCCLPEVESNVSPDEESWRHPTDSKRIVFLYTDATFYPTTLDRSATAIDIAKKLIKKKLQLWMLRPDTPCFDVFDSLPSSGTLYAFSAPFTRSAREFCDQDLSETLSYLWKHI